jgi:hypothetical protein
MKLRLPAAISCSSSRCAPTSDVTSSENCETHAVYMCQICKSYNRIFIFKKSLNSHICVIWLLSYIHSAYIHSWHNVIYEKSKTIYQFPSPYDVSLSSANIVQISVVWHHGGVFETVIFMCSRTIFPFLFRGFFSSDLDYNISYTDPSYSEQNSGRWKMPSKVGNIALKHLSQEVILLNSCHFQKVDIDKMTQNSRIFGLKYKLSL